MGQTETTTPQNSAQRELFQLAESIASSLPSDQGVVILALLRLVAVSERGEREAAAENQKLRRALSLPAGGAIPVQAAPILVWPFESAPVRIEILAPVEAVRPAWVLAYKTRQADELSASLSQLRNALQTAPHDLCLRRLHARTAEFLW